MVWYSKARTIACVARNFVAHAQELNNPLPKAPFFFLKPVSSILDPGGVIQLPKGGDVHHEVELAVVMGKRASRVKPEDALDYVSGYALAIDLTARNFQAEEKKKGYPWTLGKTYDTFLPLGPFVPKEQIKDPQNVEIWLNVNGEERQRDSTNLMIFKIPELIAAVTDVMTLEEGDMICTGTPKGVASIKHGDVVTAGIEGLEPVKFDVIDRPAASL